MRTFLKFLPLFLVGNAAYCVECPDLNGTFLYSNPNSNNGQPSSLETSDIRIRIESKLEGDFRSYAIGTNTDGPITSPAVIADGLPHQVSRGFGKEFDTYTCLNANTLEMRIDLKDNPYDSEIDKIEMLDKDTITWQMRTKHNPLRTIKFVRAY